MDKSKVEIKYKTNTKIKCNHDYIKNKGIITCSKCDIKAILYLTPLKK